MPRLFAPIALNAMQVALHERQAALVLPGQPVENVLAVQIAGLVQLAAGKGHRFDHECRPKPLRRFAEQQQTGQRQRAIADQPHIL